MIDLQKKKERRYFYINKINDKIIQSILYTIKCLENLF